MERGGVNYLNAQDISKALGITLHRSQIEGYGFRPSFGLRRGKYWPAHVIPALAHAIIAKLSTLTIEPRQEAQSAPKL